MPITLGSMRGYMGPTIDPATSAWVNAVYANGGTVSASRRTTVNDLIVGLKADSLFSKLDNLLLFAAENEPSALTDLVAGRLATNVGATAFVANDGYTGDGASSYIDTNFNLVNNAVNYSLNSAHHSFWMLSATEAAGGNRNFDGCYDGVNLTDFITGVSPAVVGRVNSPSEDIPGTGTDGYRGHWIINRSSATQGQVYLNGVSSGVNNALSAGGVPAHDMFVLARNDFGNPALWTVGPVACFSAGGSFSATEAFNFFTRLDTYMAAVGAA